MIRAFIFVRRAPLCALGVWSSTAPFRTGNGWLDRWERRVYVRAKDPTV